MLFNEVNNPSAIITRNEYECDPSHPAGLALLLSGLVVIERFTRGENKIKYTQTAADSRVAEGDANCQVTHFNGFTMSTFGFSA